MALDPKDDWVTDGAEGLPTIDWGAVLEDVSKSALYTSFLGFLSIVTGLMDVAESALGSFADGAARYAQTLVWNPFPVAWRAAQNNLPRGVAAFVVAIVVVVSVAAAADFLRRRLF